MPPQTLLQLHKKKIDSGAGQVGNGDKIRNLKSNILKTHNRYIYPRENGKIPGNDLIYALRMWGKALAFIYRRGLWWYFLFPVVLNLLLFTAGFRGTTHLAEVSMEALNQWLNIPEWGFTGSGLLAGVIHVILWITFRVIFFLLFAFLGGYVILVLLSPVFAFISEHTEKIISGNDISFRWTRFLNDTLRGILLATRNFTLELFLTILLLFANFIPGAGLFTPLLLLVVSAYFYGFSFIDYTLERKAMGPGMSIFFVQHHRALVIGYGLPFALILMIPVIGVLLSGFMAVVAVVAATLGTITTPHTPQYG